MTDNQVENEDRRDFMTALQGALGTAVIGGVYKFQDLYSSDLEYNEPIEIGLYQTEILTEDAESFEHVEKHHPAKVAQNYIEHTFEQSDLSELDYEVNIVDRAINVDEEHNPDLETIHDEFKRHLNINGGYEDSNILITADQYEEGDGVANTGVRTREESICGASHESTGSAVLGSGILLNWIDQNEVREAEVGQGTEDPAAVAIGALNKLGYNLCLDSTNAKTTERQTTPMGLGEIDDKKQAKPVFSQRSVNQILEGYRKNQ